MDESGGSTTSSTSLTDVVDVVLAHFGKKGMRWGVRNSRSSTPDGPVKVVVKSLPGKKIKTTGGKNQPASEEAKETAAIRQLGKASKTTALTNKELQTVITRMNLEQNYARVTAPKSGIKAYVAKLLMESGKKEAASLSQGTQGPIMKQLSAIMPSKVVGTRRK